MEITEYDPPNVEPYVLTAIRFDPWPFVETYVAVNPTVVRRRIDKSGHLSQHADPGSTWSLSSGNFLVDLSDGETVIAHERYELDLYLNRTGTP